MQRTENSNLSLFLSGLKSARRILVLVLALTATSVFAQGVLTLAMVRYDQSPTRTPAAARNNFATCLLCYDAPAPRLQNQVAAVKFDNQNRLGFSFDSRLEKQSSSNQRDLLQLVHKKLYADGRAGKWMDVAAGYGQIYPFESGIAQNTDELQRPGFAYLKASFSF